MVVQVPTEWRDEVYFKHKKNMRKPRVDPEVTQRRIGMGCGNVLMWELFK